jgi:hypothetical protein
MDTQSASNGSHGRLAVVELIAKIVLAFGVGLAVSMALAGVVLLLAHDAQAAQVVSVLSCIK